MSHDKLRDEFIDALEKLAHSQGVRVRLPRHRKSVLQVRNISISTELDLELTEDWTIEIRVWPQDDTIDGTGREIIEHRRLGQGGERS